MKIPPSETMKKMKQDTKIIHDSRITAGAPQHYSLTFAGMYSVAACSYIPPVFYAHDVFATQITTMGSA